MKRIEHLIRDYILDGGPARLETADGQAGALFLDENEFVPFADLGYSQGLGFYRLSEFPDVANEAGDNWQEVEDRAKAAAGQLQVFKVAGALGGAIYLVGQRWEQTRNGSAGVYDDNERLIAYLDAGTWRSVAPVEDPAPILADQPAVTVTIRPALWPGPEAAFLKATPVEQLQTLIERALVDALTEKATEAAGHARGFERPFALEVERRA